MGGLGYLKNGEGVPVVFKEDDLSGSESFHYYQSAPENSDEY